MDRNFDVSLNYKEVLLSLSVRRAWIEIFCQRYPFGYFGVSLSVRRAWIEMLTDDVSTGGKIKSLSVRRAWIEIITA